MKQISTMTIDDERASRNELKRMLSKYPDFHLAAEAGDVEDAIAAVNSLRPDIIFLDIQMPEKTGFELLELLEYVPMVVFTTGYDQYAIQAFEFCALDYLLKPIREERFEVAIARIRERMAGPDNGGQFFVKDRQQYHLIRWSSVYLVESADNYSRIFYDGKDVLKKGSLNQLEEQMGNAGFFRINRSQLVGRKYIRTIESIPGNRLKLTLHNGSAVEVSERQSVKFKTWAAAK